MPVDSAGAAGGGDDVLEGRLLRLLVVGACVATLGASLLHPALWVATVERAELSVSILTMFCAALYREIIFLSSCWIKFYVLRTVYCHMRILWSTHASMSRFVESDLRSSQQ